MRQLRDLNPKPRPDDGELSRQSKSGLPDLLTILMAKSGKPDFAWGEGWGEGAPAMNGSPELPRRLRRNQTDTERVLWFQLRGRRLRGLKFKRQAAIDRYIVDFCCADAHLIIELDGGQHATRTLEDANRTKILEAMGYLVLRFWNNDVLQNLDGVLEEILNTVTQHRSEPPHPDPLPIEVGFIRLRSRLVANSGKSEFAGEREKDA